MTYTPKHLKLWKHPECYLGATWYDYYVVLGQHRDSDRVTRSNFAVAKAELEAIEDKYPEWNKADDEGRMLVNPYEGHWAVGHVEWLGIHKDSPEELIEAADNILDRIENYPILDESHYSDLEWNEANDYWESESVSSRIQWLKNAGIPCFAARHGLSTIMHEYDNKADRLWERLTND